MCLCMCATTRGVHLEIMTDLTTETFLLVLRRFVSQKSLPQIIVSDNGSTYLSAAEELKELLSSRKLAESYLPFWVDVPRSLYQNVHLGTVVGGNV